MSLFFVDRKEQDHEVPMARVRERALSIAADLTARGVRNGDRVALVLPTCPEFVECLFGVLCAGAIPVPLYPPVRLGRLEEYHAKTAAMLRAVDAALVVTDERIRRFLGASGSARGSSPGLCDRVEPGRHEFARDRGRCRRRGVDPILLGHHAMTPSRWR